MKYITITLKRTPERRQQFEKTNSKIQTEYFEAIDGKSIDRFNLNPSFITDSLKERYTDGALGVATSHKLLWERCIEENTPLTILEDDAILCSNFTDIVEKNTYDDGWDIIFWGSNLDQNIGVHLVPGMMYTEMRTLPSHFLSNIDKVSSAIVRPTLYRCSFAVGLVCYSVSPKGARYLLDNVFPLRDYDKPYLNYGIDHSVLEELNNCVAWYSIPPAAFTKNDVTVSTVQK